MSNLPRIYVKPTNGNVVVINPETNRRIPADGELVLNNQYFRRRIAEGDVVETSPPAESPKATPKNTKTAPKED